MRIFDIVRRLLSAGALVLLAGLAISVVTHDAWIVVGHAASVLAAIMAALAVMVLVVSGLRRFSRPSRLADKPTIMPHELGLTGLEAEAPGDQV